MKGFTFTFTEKEVQTVLNSLGNMPYLQVFELIDKIQAEGAKQQEQKSEEKPK